MGAGFWAMVGGIAVLVVPGEGQAYLGLMLFRQLSAASAIAGGVSSIVVDIVERVSGIKLDQAGEAGLAVSQSFSSKFADAFSSIFGFPEYAITAAKRAKTIEDILSIVDYARDVSSIDSIDRYFHEPVESLLQGLQLPDIQNKMKDLPWPSSDRESPSPRQDEESRPNIVPVDPVQIRPEFPEPRPEGGGDDPSE